MRKPLLALLCFFCAAPLLHAQVLINEVSAANRAILADYQNDYEDWLELFNASDSPVNIGGFFLSDRLNNLTKYQIPAITIPANGRVLFFASGKNTVASGEYHLNFKLTQTTNERLILSNASAQIIDSLTLRPIQVNQSMGRISDGANTWGIFTTPTPNAPNIGASFAGFAPVPVLLPAAGFYTSAQQVSMQAPAGYEIRYTTNGAQPIATSTLYTGPVDVSATTHIKARCFPIVNTTLLPSFIESNTYFINQSHPVPVVSLGSNQYANLFQNGSLIIQSSIEYFDENGQQQFESWGEVDRHGNDSWAFQQKGVEFVVRDQLGYSDQMHHQIFPNKPRAAYQRVLLKAGASDNYPFTWGNGGCHVRDAFIQSLSQKANLELDGRTTRSVVVYINGQYWGIYEIREKVNDPDYTDFYYGQKEQDIDLLSYWGSLRVRYGSSTDWFDLFNYIINNDVTQAQVYQNIGNRLDLLSVIDHMILNTFAVNSDWINWNSMWWRGRAGQGVKWKYTNWDMDNIFNLGHNYSGLPTTGFMANPCDLNQNFGNAGAAMGHIRIFNRLMQNPEFKSMYVNRYAQLINTYLSCDVALAHLDSMVNVLAMEMPRHTQRWGGSMAGWENNLNFMRNQITGRCSVITNIIQDCYQVTGPYALNFNVMPAGGGNIRFNLEDFQTYPHSANYFGSVIGKLLATPAPGYVFDYWEIFNHTLSPGNESAQAEFLIGQADSIVAHFRLIPVHTLVLLVEPAGAGLAGINGIIPGAYPHSTTLTDGLSAFFNAIPNANFAFETYLSQHHSFIPDATQSSAGFIPTQSDTVIARFKPLRMDTLIFKINPPNAGNIELNGNYLPSNPYQEIFLPESPVEMVAHAFPGYLFDRWETQTHALSPAFDSASVNFSTEGNDIITAIFSSIEPFPQTVYLPNAFTPNNDGLNDFFQLYHSETVTQAGIRVYNRWGETVFQSDEINFKWDGTKNGNPMPADVYYYTVNYNVKGKLFKDLQGRILLMR